MTPDIIAKLQMEIDVGIKTEAQVVYLLAGIRKIIERENLGQKYFYLKFHCDWALHPKLDRKPAQYVLSHFDSLRLQLITGKKLTPNSEVDKISRMDIFREELSAFLQNKSVTDFSSSSDKWLKFLYLYAHVIEDMPLVIKSGSASEIQEVVVSIATAKKLMVGHQLFRVSWRITDKAGNSGTIFIINSYQVKKSVR